MSFFKHELILSRLTATLVFITFSVALSAQVPLRSLSPSGSNFSSPQNRNTQSDTIGFEHRNVLADSVSITYRKFDSLDTHTLDTSVNDFNVYYSLPADYVSIGVNGNAAYPILFTPEMKPGWDPGLHALDVYKFTIQNTRFYQTTKPFTTLGYFQGTGTEQIIKVFHTQNIRPNWNAGFNFRMISNPGVFQNQNAKHNNYRFFSSYQGRRKRFAAELIILGNKQVTAENGGITDPSFLADPDRKRRVAIPVELGNDAGFSNTILSSSIQAGNRYNDFDFFFRPRYDFGKKDSIKVNDSTTEYLFYPKLRFQYEFRYSKSSYQFIDNLNNFASNKSDSVFFSDFYNLQINPTASSLSFIDQWKYLSNDFSVTQFPETKNQRQFLKAGIRFENYTGAFTHPFIPDNILLVFPKPPVTKKYYNGILHGEYRNKTRNKKWDALLKGEFYLAGFYAGEYGAQASVSRFLNDKWGTVELFFSNTSRSPSFVFQSNSAFNLDSTSLTKKENVTMLGFRASNSRFNLTARNISIANYAYLTNYYQKDQFDGLVNITQGIISFKTKLKRHLNLYSDFILQQTSGKNPVRVPLLYTRQRLAFEGRFFKNMELSTGLDVRYNTPYTANHYSPVLGRFFPQDSIQISNLPTLNAFFNFRVRTNFTMFINAENLNTLDLKNGFAFTNNSFAAPFYPTPGFIFIFGVKWEMVN